MGDSPEILVIGAGLAGAEAAWQGARRGVRVILCEMRPGKMTPAHHTGLFAELVCSNSFRSDSLDNAAGLLKEEMRRLDSLIMRCADATRVPAGKALAVDRDRFASLVTRELEDHPLVAIRREEVARPPHGLPVIVATGPLTSEALAAHIRQLLGQDYLHFYDAATPIVLAESLDMKKAFRASRYGRGEDYVNCPLNEAEYALFWEALVKAERAPVHGFEPDTFFEGCLPIEELARRGKRTLLFGPMKPVGLVDPVTGRRPYAVAQLRQDDLAGKMYNMVGFQTRLKWGEQRRVFRLIPGMEKAEFVRYGVMHRNTFLKSPVLLRPTLATIGRADLFFAGQITGVEGYLESAAMGLVAGINAARIALGLEPVVFPPQTAHGALCRYITTASPDSFQPMKVSFGLLPELRRPGRGRGGDSRVAQSRRALEALEGFKAAAGL